MTKRSTRGLLGGTLCVFLILVVFYTAVLHHLAPNIEFHRPHFLSRSKSSPHSPQSSQPLQTHKQQQSRRPWYNSRETIGSLLRNCSYLDIEASYSSADEPDPPILPSLLYWTYHPGLDEDMKTIRESYGLLPVEYGKYLTFETDSGGFNNIRLAFEYFVTVAALTGRVLILPPPARWYLLDKARRYEGYQDENGCCSEYSDFFDVESMRQALPVLNTDQLLAAMTASTTQSTSQQKGEIPVLPSPPNCMQNFTAWSHFPDAGKYEKGKHRLEEWASWSRHHFTLMFWNPGSSVVYYPSIGAVNAVMDSERKALSGGRNPVEYDNQLNKVPVIHFAMKGSLGHRYMTPAISAMVFADERMRRSMNRFRKHHIHFRPEIFYLASRAIRFLNRVASNSSSPLEDEDSISLYSSMHVRRGDFQFGSSKTSAESTIQRTSALLRPGEVLYLSTDEKPPFFGPFRERYQVYQWGDFLTERGGYIWKGLKFSPKWSGMIEQIICSKGRLFFGTTSSTFTSYIHRLRGFIPTVQNTKQLWHNHEHHEGEGEGEAPPETVQPNDWSRDYPASWQDI